MKVLLIFLFICFFLSTNLNAQLSSEQIKILTFNTWYNNYPFDIRLALMKNQIAELNPDLIALQEIYQGVNSDSTDNTAWIILKKLEAETGQQWYMFDRRLWSFSNGLSGMSIISRYPILEERFWDLPDGTLERELMMGLIESPVGPLHFYNTHLSLANVLQATQMMADILENDSTYINRLSIICGDMNATPNDVPVQIIMDPLNTGIIFYDTWDIANPGLPGYTAVAGDLSIRIDYIFSANRSGVNIDTAEVVLNQTGGNNVFPSDHLGVLTTLNVDVNLIGLNILNPQPDDVVSGMVPISWEITDSSESVQADIFISNDRGVTWERLAQNVTENTYNWDSISHPDGTRYLLKIYVLGDLDYGLTVMSGSFYINNPGNAPPDLELISPQTGDLLTGEYTIKWISADPEGDSLTHSVEFTTNNGTTWHLLSSNLTDADSLTVNTNNLANSPFYQFRITSSDGLLQSTVTSGHVQVENPRIPLSNDIFHHISGNGSGTIKAKIVDMSATTDHVYQLSFQDSIGITYYNVYDKTSDELKVDKAAIFDAVSEGPIFDGLRLIISDFSPAQINFDESGWTMGNSTMEYSVFLSTIEFDSVLISGFPYPADYEITFFDQVVDTSVSYLGAPAQPMAFQVKNLSEDRISDIIFIDFDLNTQLTPLDEIHILEKDSAGQYLLTWSAFFSGDENTVLPEVGDVFLISVLKPFTSNDLFEFSTSFLGIADEDEMRNRDFRFYQNYPNPFNHKTKIKFALSKTEKVKIEIFNLLGQKIKTLLNQKMPAGSHEVEFTAKNLPSGVYYYRIEAGNASTSSAYQYQQVKKMILLK